MANQKLNLIYQKTFLNIFNILINNTININLLNNNNLINNNINKYSNTKLNLDKNIICKDK